MPIPVNVREALRLEMYNIHSITGYNRLEVSPRTEDFERSLRAEVRDALWMLTRQWQFGEFQGEDAASIVSSKIQAKHTKMRSVVFPQGVSTPYEEGMPLERLIEQEAPRGELHMALQMARYFVRLIRHHHPALLGWMDELQLQYPLNYAPHRNDLDGLQLKYALEEELFDGFALSKQVGIPGEVVTPFKTWMNTVAISPGEQAQFNIIVTKFQNWLQRNFSREATASAWLPSQLEYRFDLLPGAQEPHQRKLTADQYFEGHIDWHTFDLQDIPPGPDTTPVEEPAAVLSFIPSPVRFKGMPHPRFWTMEEGLTDFGRIDTTTTGLLHLLLAEFGLVYSNDWFLLPYPLATNTLCEIEGITVTDVFNQRTLVRPAGKGENNNWHRWAMFNPTVQEAVPAIQAHRRLDPGAVRRETNLFYLPASISHYLESEPLEKVNFLRDEMANLVWAVENRVPSQSGKGVSGMEMARPEIKAPAFVAVNKKVPVRYVAGTSVPQNWIPFIPVRMEGSDREIRLQRARLPDATGGKGLILTEKAAPYFIDEIEVPRSGISVQRCWQRTRWYNGRSFLWMGRYKEMGKGEGWSNLQFDQVWDIPDRLNEERDDH